MKYSAAIVLYEEPEGALVVQDEFLALLQQGIDRELGREVVVLVSRLEGLADGRLDPVCDRYDGVTDPKPWIYWRPAGRIGVLYHVSDERPGQRMVLVLRVAQASLGLPAAADIQLARQRLDWQPHDRLNH